MFVLCRAVRKIQTGIRACNSERERDADRGSCVLLLQLTWELPGMDILDQHQQEEESKADRHCRFSCIHHPLERSLSEKNGFSSSRTTTSLKLSTTVNAYMSRTDIFIGKWRLERGIEFLGETVISYMRNAHALAMV